MNIDADDFVDDDRVVLIDAQTYRFVEIICSFKTRIPEIACKGVSQQTCLREHHRFRFDMIAQRLRRTGADRPWVDRIGGHFEALTRAG
jgi:hypothetical protein